MIYLLIPIVLFCIFFSYASFRRKENAGKFAFRALIHAVTISTAVIVLLLFVAWIIKYNDDKRYQEKLKQQSKTSTDWYDYLDQSQKPTNTDYFQNPSTTWVDYLQDGRQ